MNTPDYVAAVLANAEAGGIHNAELAALRRRLRQLADPQAGLLPGEVLQPVADLPRLDELPEPPTGRARDVLDRLVVIKLNGGLGTSMGLPGPKSLLEVKPGMSFLDVLATQVLVLRERYRARLPLVLMNSAATRDASLEVLGGYSGLRVPGVPLDFLQGREPKIRADNWLPARWPAAGAGMVPARARRHLHRAGGVRHAGCPARCRAAVRLRIQFRQPRRARRCPDRRMAGRRAGAVRAGGGARHAGRPQGRPPGPLPGPGGAAGDRAGARRRHLVHRHRALALV